MTLACPCDQDCPNGCQGCSNSICEDSNFSTTGSIIATTTVPSQKAALMLNTARSDNVPMVITFNGKLDYNLLLDDASVIRGHYLMGINKFLKPTFR